MRFRPELLALALTACPGESDDDADASTTDVPPSPTSTSSGTAEPTTTTTTTDGPYEHLDERPCPDDSPLTVINFGAPFMLSHCTGCHHSALGEDERAGAPPGVDFDDLSGVRSHADRIWARAADQNATMPPLGGPAQDDRTRLGEWLACGAP